MTRKRHGGGAGDGDGAPRPIHGGGRTFDAEEGFDNPLSSKSIPELPHGGEGLLNPDDVSSNGRQLDSSSGSGFIGRILAAPARALGLAEKVTNYDWNRDGHIGHVWHRSGDPRVVDNKISGHAMLDIARQGDNLAVTVKALSGVTQSKEQVIRGMTDLFVEVTAAVHCEEGAQLHISARCLPRSSLSLSRSLTAAFLCWAPPSPPPPPARYNTSHALPPVSTASDTCDTRHQMAGMVGTMVIQRTSVATGKLLRS
jgi:hypothetical protein